jgi:hypothetical protein
MPPNPFSLASAVAAAHREEIALWVGDFLSSPGSDNPVLAVVLAQRPHWWIGPVRIELDRLERMAGPEDDVVCTVDEDEWENDVGSMEDSLEEGWQPPPLLVQSIGGTLRLEDGNHRYEALVRAGESHGWVLIFFDDPDARDRFIAENPPVAAAPTNG